MERRRLGWHLLFPVLLVLILTACSGGASPSPTPKAGSSTPVSGTAAATARPTTGQNTDKISAVFLQLVSIYETQGFDAARTYAMDQGLLTKQGEVRVTLVLDSADANVVDGTAIAVGRLGARVTASFDNQIELVMPAQALLEYQKKTNRQSFFRDLADFTHVTGVQRTPIAVPSSTIADPAALRQAMATVTGAKSEGIGVTGADKWQAAGITGKGVKVGIIDGAFNDYKKFLPVNKVTTKSFRSDGLLEDPDDEESIHGTACAEIVNEMAPDADLYLATYETTGGFISAIRWLESVGVTVVSNSTSWRGDFPLDDSSPPSQEVDKAKAAGIFFATSAGNNASGEIDSDSGGGHYGAVFTDSDKDGWHDFPGAAKKNSLKIRVGEGFYIRMNWDDWKNTHVNYDLYLYDEKGTEVTRSTDDQSKGTGRKPLELIGGSTIKKGTYYLKVKKVNPADPDLAMNMIFRGAQFEIVTPEGSLGAPADARGAVAVAALDWKTDVIEDFSSRGPTLDGRKKPDIGAPDNTSGFAFASIGEASFPGTSSATPHMAGAAALYKQAFPNSTPDEMLKFFADRAVKPKGAQVGDNITGAGRLFFGAVPQNVSSQPAPTKAGGSKPATAVPTRTATQPATTSATGTAAFSDDFSSPSSGLPAAGYRNGEYHIAAQAGTLLSGFYSGKSVQGATSETYEVQVRRASGADDAAMGLAVRRLDQENYLLFVITNDGFFGLYAKVDGSLSLLTNLAGSTAIKAGEANTLRVTITGTKFVFAANGQPLASWAIDDVWTEGGFGIVAGGGDQNDADIAFDNYRVTLG